ncbi:hypothetical protein CHUAL_012472 [Chamberlinius hualienensis]
MEENEIAKNEYETAVMFSYNFGIQITQFAIELSYVYDKDWLWDFHKILTTYPHQNLDQAATWIYCLSLAHFISETIYLLKYPSKLFWIKFIHHFLSYILLVLTWISNFSRISIITLFFFRFAPLISLTRQATKMFASHTINRCLYVLFILVWIITRNIIYFNLIFICFIEFPLHLLGVIQVAVILLAFALFVMQMIFTGAYFIIYSNYHKRVKKDEQKN